MSSRPNDWISWRLYRRGWVVPAIAFLIVLATSFGPEAPPSAPLPPTFTDEQGVELVERAARFDELFADRTPGSPGAVESAQWVEERLAAAGLEATSTTTTSDVPLLDEAVGLVNVAAVLPGRTSESVYVVAARDTWGKRPDPQSAVGTLALVALAEELADSRDRRRTYVFVSTDGASVGAGGARAVATDIADERRAPTAIITLDRIAGNRDDVLIPFSPSGQYTPAVGITSVMRDALADENLDNSLPGTPAQLVHLAVPVTTRQYGQFVRQGLPAVEISSAPTEPPTSGAVDTPDPLTAAAIVRTVQRVLGTLDGVDTLQTSGKTYILGGDRVYRGWALKVLVASLLVPAWLGLTSMIVRMRRRINLVVVVGTVARAMMGGIWAVASFWFFGMIGLIANGSEVPPPPAAVGSLPVIATVLWIAVATGGWILTRGPDWRLRNEQHLDLSIPAVGLVGLSLLTGLALAVNPYIVLLAVPALHLWLLIPSTRLTTPAQRLAALAAGCITPIVAWLAASAMLGTGSVIWYWLVAIQVRAVPGSLSLIIAAGIGIVAVIAMAVTGHISQPLLHRIRQDGALHTAKQLPAIARARARAASGSAPVDNSPARAPARSRRSTPARPPRAAGRNRVKTR